jgi:hypothetical protein
MLRRKLLATSLALAVAAAALSGCVRNQPVAAVDWLDRQGGVADATILSDNTDAWSSSGLVHGELEPDIDDAGIQRLIDEIKKFWRNNPSVSFRLGWHGVDFAVSDDDAANDDAMSLWHAMIDIPTIKTAVAYSDAIDAHTLRDGTVDALGKLGDLPADLWVEAFANEQDLAQDTSDDYDYNGYESEFALGYWIPDACEPDAAVREYAESLLSRDDIEGGLLQLCIDMTLGLPSGTSLAQAAPALRAELDERGLSEFPVTAHTELTGDYDTHTAAITPGDAGALAVLGIFEDSGIPDLFYDLDGERTLTVTAYAAPTADILALVQTSPAAAALPQIVVEGTPVKIYGPLSVLPDLLAQAVALDDASATFGSIELGVDTGSAFLDYEVGSQPDVVTAAADLRASGATVGRTFTIRMQSMEVYITDGVAQIADPGYTSPETMLAFVDAWNAGN